MVDTVSWHQLLLRRYLNLNRIFVQSNGGDRIMAKKKTTKKKVTKKKATKKKAAKKTKKKKKK